MTDQDIQVPVDPVGEALHFLRMSGTFYCRSEFTAPWGLALPAMPHCLMLHVLTAGQCWLETDDSEPLQLQPGELTLVPHGQGHRLTSELGVSAAPLFDLPRESVSERYEVLRHGGGGAPTSLICAAIRFDHPAAHQLLRLLPRVIRVDTSNSAQKDWMQSTLRFIEAEAQALRPGGETVITRLADILVIQAIRAWLEHDSRAQTGWLAALQDKQIGRAITLIHRAPAQAWTLQALASEVAMSRSAFAARFTELVGEPAMHYLARWRMYTAVSWLEEQDIGIADLAGRLGYQSEAAFSRAFKRLIGISPGAVRRNAQT